MEALLRRPALQEHAGRVRQPGDIVEQKWIRERLDHLAIRTKDEQIAQTLFCECSLSNCDQFAISRPRGSATIQAHRFTFYDSVAASAVVVGDNKLRLGAAEIIMNKNDLLAIGRKTHCGAQVAQHPLRRATETGNRIEDLLIFILWIVVRVENIVSVRRKGGTMHEVTGPRSNYLGFAAGRDLLYPKTLLITSLDECRIATVG